MPKLYLGTRKGLFTLGKKSGNWQIERVDFEGDPIAMLLPGSDGSLYASFHLGHFGTKLHRSADGASFEEVGVPSYEGLPAPAEGKAPTLELLWALECAGKDGHLWAGTGPGGLFKSTDRGATWTLNQPLWDVPGRSDWFGGGYDFPGIHSVAVHPNNPLDVLVAVSCAGVWATLDGGETWELRGQGLRAAYMPPGQALELGIQDPHRLVQCPANPDHLWVQHHNGIFYSTDRGRTFEEVSPELPNLPSTFGFAVAVHPTDPKTAWFVPAVKDEKRIPVDGKLVVTRTRDGGQSFEALTEGLPQENAYHLVYRHSLEVDSSGEVLAFGSTTGSVWISENGGDSWERVSAELPPVYCLRFGI